MKNIKKREKKYGVRGKKNGYTTGQDLIEISGKHAYDISLEGNIDPQQLLDAKKYYE